MVLVCMVLFAGCEKDSDLPNALVKPLPSDNFSIRFIVHDASDDDLLFNEGGYRKTWRGKGWSPMLGEFLVEINLICDIDNLLFNDMAGIIEAQDGSKLFFNIPDGAYCSNHACDVFQVGFNDLAEISRGTGRFERVTGSFYPNAKFHNGDRENWFGQFSCVGKIDFNE